ncbi:uncharacterized protein LOC108053369 [Drosophila rhopaloa]|uniref:Uncharacterized protein LOC108053369 n=1 Tax=Drosophila rhopaloa TaxID=1041015 RepID=A0A6P4FP19_DRORH|nr:uncharacterized protein LOC108053369 [Drosophila rhopaloa]
MKIDYVVDQGPCNTELRSWCIGIAIYWLVSMTLTVLVSPNVLNFIGFVIVIIANVCLLIGTQRENRKLVFVWLIFAIIEVISFPFAVFGVIFHYGGYREATGVNNTFGALLVYIIVLIFMLFAARIVYSFYLQLKSREESNPPRTTNVV